MRNRYPKACSICRGVVPADEGVLWKEGVLHDGACPRGPEDDGSIRVGHAQAYTRRVTALLRRADLDADEIEEAVGGLAALVRTQWTALKTCERILLGSPAMAARDRMTVELVLGRLVGHLLLEESHA